MFKFYLILSILSILACANKNNNQNETTQIENIEFRVVIHQKDQPNNIIYFYELLSDSLTVVDFNKTSAKDFNKNWEPDTTTYKLISKEFDKLLSLIEEIPYSEDEEVPILDATELRIIIDGKLQFHRTAYGRGIPDSRPVDNLLDYLSEITGVEFLLFGYTDQ